MQKKTDRRVRKTKSQLRKGLAHLMKEKSIGEITVKELVDEVDINRSTFYLHYSDIPTLLREIENEMMDEMKRAIHDHPIDRENDSAFSFIKDIFQVLDRNREIGCALIGPYGDIGFIHKMEDLLEENSREVLLQMFPEKHSIFIRSDLTYKSRSCSQMSQSTDRVSGRTSRCTVCLHPGKQILYFQKGIFSDQLHASFG